MAEQLATFDFSSRPSRRRPMPDEWFNGHPWRLCLGEDFSVKPASFQVRYKAEARERGMVGRTRLLNTDIIVVRAERNGQGG